MTIQTIKRNISKLLIVVLAAMLMIAFIPGDVQAGLENLANSPINGTEGHSLEDTIYNIDNHLIDRVPTYEEFTDPSGDYQYTANKYVTMTEYVDAYPNVSAYADHIVRIDTALELYKLSVLTNPSSDPNSDLNKLLAKTSEGFEAILRHFLSLNYALGNNIDWNDDAVMGRKFMPIGRGDPNNAAYERPFTGTFDGQGFEITDLVFETHVDDLQGHIYYGFFSYVGATGVVRNFGLYNPVINTRSLSNVMRVAGICGKNAGTIEYVYVAGSEFNPVSYAVMYPVGVAGLVYENMAGATFRQAYYTGLGVSADSYVNWDNVYPVYFTNQSENVEQLFYNRDIFKPVNKLRNLAAEMGFFAFGPTYSASWVDFRDAPNGFNAVTGVTTSQTYINHHMNGTSVPSVAELSSYVQYFGLSSVNDIYTPTRIPELVNNMDWAEFPMINIASFRTALNSYVPTPPLSQINFGGWDTVLYMLSGSTAMTDDQKLVMLDFFGLYEEYLLAADQEAFFNDFLSQSLSMIVDMGYISNYDRFTEMYNAWIPEGITNVSTNSANLKNYINGSLAIPDTVRDKLFLFFDEYDSFLAEAPEDQEAFTAAFLAGLPARIQTKGYDVVIYENFRTHFNATLPTTSYSQGVIDGIIFGDLKIPEVCKNNDINSTSATTVELRAKFCAVLGLTDAELNDPAKIQAAILKMGVPEGRNYPVGPSYTGLYRQFMTTAPYVYISEQATINNWVYGLRTITSAAPGDRADYVAKFCDILGVANGDIFPNNRNLNDPYGEVRGVRNDELLERKWCLTDDAWRRNDYRGTSSIIMNCYNFPLSTYPKLQGFTGDLDPVTLLPRSWNGASTEAQQYIIKTPADLVYFGKFLSAGNNLSIYYATPTTTPYIRDRYYRLGACIDMGTVAPDAYRMYYGDSSPDSWNLAFTGRFHGDVLDSVGDVCDCEHLHTETFDSSGIYFSGSGDTGIPLARGSNHNIINLTLTQELATNAYVTSNTSCSLAYVPTQQYVSGFIPLLSGSLDSVNFIGGSCSPANYNTNANKANSIYFVGGAVGLAVGGNVRNIHSSMSVSIPDGPGLSFGVGGIVGSCRVTRYCSFSGTVSGGIHPYDETQPPNADSTITSNSGNRYMYYTGGIVGHSPYIGVTHCVNYGRVEAAGFYDIPTGTEYPVYGGVAAGGIVGGNDSTAADGGAPRNGINYGDIWSVPIDAATGEPRTAPDGQTVYAISPTIGGISGRSLHLNFVYNNFTTNLIDPRNAHINYGDVHAINAVGDVYAAGMVGGIVSTPHSNYFDRAVNFGNVYVSNCADGSRLMVAGLANSLYSNYIYPILCMNYGNIVVDDSNSFSAISAGGLATNWGTTNIWNSQNYGSITVDNSNADCATLRVAGNIATSSVTLVPGGTDKRAAHNYGDLTVTTNQTAGTISVAGISDNGISNGSTGVRAYGTYNGGDIIINATATSANVNIYAGGIKGYSGLESAVTWSAVYDSMNTGDITVNANTQGTVYVGGIRVFSSDGAGNLNTGDISVVNDGTGAVYVGGISGWDNSNAYNYDLTNEGNITVRAAGDDIRVGGIFAWKANANVSNAINFGHINVTSTSTATPKVYVSGLVNNLYTSGAATGINTGMVNHGDITLVQNAADTSQMQVAGIGTDMYCASRDSRINGYINYGTITADGVDAKAAIWVMRAWPAYCERVRVTNMLNTDSNSSMFYQPINAQSSNAQNYAESMVLYNLFTTNSKDPLLDERTDIPASTYRRYYLFYGRVTYLPDDAEPAVTAEEAAANGTEERPYGIYNEACPLRDPKYGLGQIDTAAGGSIDARDNASIVYCEPDYAAGHLMSKFTDGLYVVTTRDSSVSVVTDSLPLSMELLDNQYLPDSLRYTGVKSMATRQYFLSTDENPNGYVKTADELIWNSIDSWFKDSGAEVEYINSKQVDVSLNIAKMSLRADTDMRLLGTKYEPNRPEIAEIQSRPVNETLVFYYGEDCLGKTFRVSSFKLTDPSALLCADENGTPWQDIIIELPDGYQDGDDVNDFTVDVPCWVIKGDEKLPFTIRLVLLPTPKIVPVVINQSQADPSDPPSYTPINSGNTGGDAEDNNRLIHNLTNGIPDTRTDGAAQLTQLADGTYVLPTPTYHYGNFWSSSNGVILFSFKSTNLTEQFMYEQFFNITYDGITYTETRGEDVTSQWRFNKYGSSANDYYNDTWNSRYTYRSNEYLSGTTKNAVNASTLTGFRLVTQNAVDSAKIKKAGWYTMAITVNGVDIFKVRFELVRPKYGRLNSYGTTTVDGVSVPYYTEDFSDFTYTRVNKSRYGLATPHYNLYATASTNDSYMNPMAGSVRLTKFITDWWIADDGTHVYKTMEAVAPAYSKINDVVETDGTITWWSVIGGENNFDTVTAQSTNVSVDGTTQGDSFAVQLPGTGGDHNVELAYRLDNADMHYPTNHQILDLAVTLDGEPLVLKSTTGTTTKTLYYQTADGLDVMKAVIKIVGTNYYYGTYSLTFTVLDNAPRGTYVVQPMYNKSYPIDVVRLANGESWPVGNTYSIYDLPTGIYLDQYGVPYADPSLIHKETLTWSSKIGDPITIVKPKSSNCYLSAMQFPESVRNEINTIPSLSPSPIAIQAGGKLKYGGSVKQTEPNRTTNFRYDVYLTDEIATTDYQPQFTLPRGASLYIWDGSDWVFVNDDNAPHTADYRLSEVENVLAVVKYMVRAEDGITEAYYDVYINPAPRNQEFEIRAVGKVGGGLEGVELNKYFRGERLDLYVSFKRWNGYEAKDVHGAAFINNNEFVLAYKFPYQTEGVYIFEFDLPDELDFELGFMTLPYTKDGTKITITIPGTVKDQIATTTFEIQIFKKDPYEPEPAPLGVRTTWQSRNAEEITEPTNGDYTFPGNVKVSQEFDYDYKTAVMSPHVETLNKQKKMYFNGEVTIPAHATIDGNVFSTQDIYIYGKVLYNVYSEGKVHVMPGGSVAGTIYEYTLS